MYSLNDLTNAFVKTENPEETSCKHQSIEARGIRVTEEEAQSSTLFNMIDRQNISFPLASGHSVPSLEEITRTQAYEPTSYHTEIPEDEIHPVDTEVTSPLNQWSFFNSMASRKVTEQQRELPVYQMSNQDHLPGMSTSK